MDISKDGNTISASGNVDGSKVDVKADVMVTGEHSVSISNISGEVGGISGEKLPSKVDISSDESGQVTIKLGKKLPWISGAILGKEIKSK